MLVPSKKSRETWFGAVGCFYLTITCKKKSRRGKLLVFIDRLAVFFAEHVQAYSRIGDQRFMVLYI